MLSFIARGCNIRLDIKSRWLICMKYVCQRLLNQVSAGDKKDSSASGGKVVKLLPTTTKRSEVKFGGTLFKRSLIATWIIR